MKAPIEIYRGFDITFDTDSETFLCYSSEWDTESGKRSYAAAKKWIDDFIKENVKFKRVLITGVIGEYADKSKLTLTGIRKDHAFMAEGTSGVSQISKYHESRYCIYQPEHDAIRAEYERMGKEIEHMQKKRDEYLKENYNPVTLDEYKKTIELP